MNNQTEMVLFGTAVPSQFADAIVVKPRFAYERVKGKDGKSRVMRNELGEPVQKLNKQGKPIETARVFSILPKTSKDGDCLKDVCGMTGQGLMGFDRELRDAAFDAAQAKVQRGRAQGLLTYGSMVERSNGTLVWTLKPTVSGKNIALMSDEEVRQEMERRGFVVAPNKAVANGEPEAPAAPEAPEQQELSAAPVKPKASKVGLTLAAISK